MLLRTVQYVFDFAEVFEFNIRTRRLKTQEHFFALIKNKSLPSSPFGDGIFQMYLCRILVKENGLNKQLIIAIGYQLSLPLFVENEPVHLLSN